MAERDELIQLNTLVREVLAKVDALQIDVKEQRDFLVGSAFSTGAVKKIDKLEVELKELQDFKKSMKWTSAGLIIGMGYTGFKFFQALIKQIFS